MEKVQGSEVQVKEMLANLELGITAVGESFINASKAETLKLLTAMWPKEPKDVLLAYQEVCNVLAQYELKVKMVRRNDVPH